MNSLMISCTKATALIEKKSVFALSFAEQFRLRMHTTLCSACAQYQQQSVLIDNLLQHAFAHLPTIASVDNTDRVNNLITKILNKK